MAGGQYGKVWDKLLSPFKQVEKRQLQHEIDVHRLFLLTSYHRLGAPGGEEAADEIPSIASRTPFAAQQSDVQSNVHRQFTSIVEVLDRALLKASISRNAKPEKIRSGLSFAIGGGAPPPRAEIAETYPLRRPEVTAILRERVGFTLECRRSEIEHEEAGDGLFLCGRAEPGTVVSIYPGVIYTPSQYRYMRGYPRVDTANPYLISRYDGLVIDGKPWGRGGDSREWWDGTAEDEKSITPEEANNASSRRYSAQSSRGLWGSIIGSPDQQPPVPISPAILERRNPLALGHIANHPPKGCSPNVMICPYSVRSDDKVSRPYVPNLVLATPEQQMERRGLLWMKDDGEEPPCADIRTLVLVATRTLRDEELLLNYRLSSHIRTPAWFHSVNEEEDQRRWD